NDLTMSVTLHEELPAIKPDEKVCTDYFGEKDDGTRVAGPLNGMKRGTVFFNIDPRKMSS
ncbi:MAG TPA: hypothetical protein VFD00_10115, partial [Thermoclostridium sp.]|nr:hypothetical protein [Thermoclostridium sp.]